MTSRQAIVVIHGMGEQRPVETLNRFSRSIAPPGSTFFSKVDKVSGSFEARRHLIPTQPGLGTQTEIYEYHWSPLMTGNRLGDLGPLLKRMLLPVPGWWGPPLALLSVAAGFFFVLSLIGPLEGSLPRYLQVVLAVAAILGVGYVLSFVPVGLAILWLLLWAGVGWLTWAAVWGPLMGVFGGQTGNDLLRGLVGGGLAAIVATFVVTRLLPRWLTSSFVDVVRYLDTSPRSYAIRREIRGGIIDLLKGLHEYGRYSRIVVVAHSLGSYIAYDAISYLWAEMAKLHEGPMLSGKEAGGATGGSQPDGLGDLEKAASHLDGSPSSIESYQKAQQALWTGLREKGNPWLVTDFISFGSPMYFAHQLYTRNRAQFDERVRKHEFVTCPPENEGKERNNVNGQLRFFSWNNGGVRVLHDAAPFAVTRWTNLWFPAAFGFFGDWFGGRLAPLFGPGILDIPITGNRPARFLPGAAHALYLGFPEDRRPGSFAKLFSTAIDLNPASWLPESKDYDPRTGGSDSTVQSD